MHNLSTLVCILQRSEFCKPNVPHMQVCSELCTSKMCHICSLLAVLLLITIIPTLKERCRKRRMREKSIARAEIGSESRSTEQATLPSNNRPCGAPISVQDYVRFRPRVEMSMQTCIYVKSRLCEGGIFSVDLVVSRPLFAGGSSLIIFEKPQHPRDSGWAHKSSEIKLICFPIVLCFERVSQNRELHSSRDPALIISSWVSAERFGAELEPRWQTVNEL